MFPSFVYQFSANEKCVFSIVPLGAMAAPFFLCSEEFVEELPYFALLWSLTDPKLIVQNKITDTDTNISHLYLLGQKYRNRRITFRETVLEEDVSYKRLKILIWIFPKNLKFDLTRFFKVKCIAELITAETFIFKHSSNTIIKSPWGHGQDHNVNGRITFQKSKVTNSYGRCIIVP